MSPPECGQYLFIVVGILVIRSTCSFVKVDDPPDCEPIGTHKVACDFQEEQRVHVHLNLTKKNVFLVAQLRINTTGHLQML
ncbi:hypothetical protein YC2023_074663 [Brassica napus]